MRIGIDARMWGKGYGIGRYIEYLLIHLMQVDSMHTYFVFVLPSMKQMIEESLMPYVKDSSRVRYVEVPCSWYSLKEQLFFPWYLYKQPLDLMHFPHWNVPYVYRRPYVVTLHDLTMFHYPKVSATTRFPLVYWIKDIAHRLLLRRIARVAKHFFVTSQFTKDDVHRTLGVPLDRMTVTYQAPFVSCDRSERILPSTSIGDWTVESEVAAQSQLHGQSVVSRFYTPRVSVHPQEWETVLSRFGLTGWYALYVGAAYPHKHLDGLLRAWKRFEEVVPQKGQYQLLLVGKKNVFYERLLASDEIKHCSQVVYADFLDDTTLDMVYRHASLFMFPSLYEGFGMPPLDAMARGIPVISSDAACMPEILGDGAYYVDTNNVDQCAEALLKVFTDQSLRQSLITAGTKVVSTYSWHRLAQETLSIYEQYK